MAIRRRWVRAAIGIGIGLASGAFATILQAQAAALPTQPSWTHWLQVTVNLSKIVEMAVFIFSGYQFWAGRRERIAADARAAEQARIDSIYQAWQVINSSQGKGGSGGRIEALADLLRNGISLAGINLDYAWLENARLSRATLRRSTLVGTNLSGADLSNADLEGADLGNAVLVTANLERAILCGANLAGARLSAAALDGADLKDIHGWRELNSISYASIEGVRNAPPGFIEFARLAGAVDASTRALPDDEDASYSQQFRIV